MLTMQQTRVDTAKWRWRTGGQTPDYDYPPTTTTVVVGQGRNLNFLLPFRFSNSKLSSFCSSWPEGLSCSTTSVVAYDKPGFLTDAKLRGGSFTLRLIFLNLQVLLLRRSSCLGGTRCSLQPDFEGETGHGGTTTPFGNEYGVGGKVQRVTCGKLL